MSLAVKLLSASGGGVDKLYVDDVFSAYTYTGNGSTQTITNGIDLAGKGGLVWLKGRSNAEEHALFDTNRGSSGNDLLQSQSTSAAIAEGGFTSFNSNGFSLAAPTVIGINNNSRTYASWTFRKAPKFFDVVTYTGNGVAGRQISHALGIAPGMMIIKRTDSADEWFVYAISLGATKYIRINTTNAAGVGGGAWNDTVPTASVFTLGNWGEVNLNGATYVAYLFAHDTSTDGIIQCGSYAGNSSAIGPTVTLGWEPQFLLIKDSLVAANWYLMDSARGLPVGGDDKFLYANSSAAESGAGGIAVTATGFYPESNNALNSSGSTYIYLAIRRPNKPPTTGTQVYNAIARTGTGVAATVTGVGFAPDSTWLSPRNKTGAYYSGISDRLRGVNRYPLRTAQTATETTGTPTINSFDQDGITYGSDTEVNASGTTYVDWFFKRAPGVFDQVCYTGTGVAKTEVHGLGVVPELMIVKSRSAAENWAVYSAAVGAAYSVPLTTDFRWAGDYWNSTPTSVVFSVGASGLTNAASTTYVAYLFATKAGISKVGSYTGNGTSQTIDCGFTTGARFVMIKRTNAVGDWYIWDTVRGLVAGNDPHLSLNTTAAEVTTNDSVDPDSTGLIVNQVAATNINVTSATYIYLAFA